MGAGFEPADQADPKNSSVNDGESDESTEDQGSEESDELADS